MRLLLAIGAAFLSGSIAAAPPSPTKTPASPPPASQPPVSPDLLSPPLAQPIEQAVTLDGKPFPAARGPAIRLPEPKRTYFVAAAKDDGDGSEQKPWRDLGAALARLTAGDRLRVRAGTYRGPITIGGKCADGSERAPIQLVFDGKAALEPGEGTPALVVARSHWLIVGAYLVLGDSQAPGIVFQGRDAHDLRLEGARIAGGLGPAIRIEPETARVAITGAYVSKSGLREMRPDSCGIDIAAGVREISVEGGRFSNNPSGSIRVRAGDSSRTVARDVQIRSNTFRDDGATAISVEAADGLIVANNTIADATGVAGTRGIALERVRSASVRTNRVAGFSIGVAVGHADPKGGAYVGADDVTLERNALEGEPGAAAFVIEAGTGVRILNNLTSGYGNGVVMFGAPPQTEHAIVANNVFLGVSDVAFMMQNPAAATLFDYNVFSPAGPVNVEIAGKAVSLSRYLKGGTMPHTQVKAKIRIVHHDLGHLEGLTTVDRGTRVEGLQFRGAAPDLGVAER